MLQYAPEQHDRFVMTCARFDALLLRVVPGHLEKDGGHQAMFDEAMRGLQKRGIVVWPSPGVADAMGAGDVLCKVSGLEVGLEDTRAFYTPEDAAAGLRRSIAYQPRLVKHGVASAGPGQGVWVVRLQSELYCREYGDRDCEDDEMVSLMEACDEHEEVHTVADFIEFCCFGRRSLTGEWATEDAGGYLQRGARVIYDQRMSESDSQLGELRFGIAGDRVLSLVHKSGKSVEESGGQPNVKFTYHSIDEPLFSKATQKLSNSLPEMIDALGLETDTETLPLWWAADFSNVAPESWRNAARQAIQSIQELNNEEQPVEPSNVSGEVIDVEMATHLREFWALKRFVCRCAGVTPKYLPACCTQANPYASIDIVLPEDRANTRAVCYEIGKTAADILQRAKVQRARMKTGISIAEMDALQAEATA